MNASEHIISGALEIIQKPKLLQEVIYIFKMPLDIYPNTIKGGTVWNDYSSFFADLEKTFLNGGTYISASKSIAFEIVLFLLYFASYFLSDTFSNNSF